MGHDIDPLELKMSHNKMLCLEVENPTEEFRKLLKEAIMENRIDHPAYAAKLPGTPFLQANYPEYLLVEFWGRDPLPFINYLREQLKKSNMR